MPSPVRVADHGAFHQQVLRTSIAGASIGLAAFLLGWALPAPGAAAKAVGLALTAAVLGLAASWPSRRALLSASLTALGIGLAGTLGMLALASTPPHYVWLGWWLYGASIGVIAGRDLARLQRLLLSAVMGITVALAAWAVGTFRLRVDLTAHVPGFLAEPAYQALFAFLASMALLVRQLRIEQDAVARSYEEVRPSLSGEMAELCERALTLYRRVRQVLDDRREHARTADPEPELAARVEDLVLRILGLGRSWQVIEREASQTSAADLSSRLEALERKIEETSDEVARRQYLLARQALAAQLRYLADISRNRERVTARVHNYVAALERLHLAVLNYRGADAAKLSDEIQPILDEIDDAGAEIELASDVLREVAEVVTAARPPAEGAASRRSASVGGSPPEPAAAADSVSPPTAGEASPMSSATPAPAPAPTATASPGPSAPSLSPGVDPSPTNSAGSSV